MGQRIAGFLVVLLLMFSGNILGQKTLISNPQGGVWSSNGKKWPLKPGFSSYNNSINKPVKFDMINLPTGCFYNNSLGFICRAELKLDKITPVPFRFRLGSLEYVNWMERKPNAKKPH